MSEAPEFVDVDITITRVSGLGEWMADNEELLIEQGVDTADIRIRWEVETSTSVVTGSSPYVPIVSGGAEPNYKFSVMHIPVEASLNFSLITKTRVVQQLSVTECPICSEWTVIQLPPYARRLQTASIALTGLPGVNMTLKVQMKEGNFAYSTIESSEPGPALAPAGGHLTVNYDPAVRAQSSSSDDDNNSEISESEVTAYKSGSSFHLDKSGKPDLPRSASSIENLKVDDLNGIVKLCDELAADEALDLPQFIQAVNQRRDEPLSESQLTNFFYQADASGAGKVTRINIFRVLFDLMATEEETCLVLVFKFISDGKETISRAEMWDVLDDVLSNFSYRSSTSRDTFIKDVIAEFYSDEQSELDLLQFKLACNKPRCKKMCAFVKFLVTENTKDEPVCVLFDIPLVFVPNCLIPDTFKKARRDYRRKCSIQ